MSDPRSNGKPTLEELLHLKRAERPNADFWIGFERELRQKQLTALVEKRRWWHDWALLSSRRIFLPVGATAMVAFAMLAVRFNGPARFASGGNTAPRIEAAEPAIEMLPLTTVAIPHGTHKETTAVAQSAPVVVEAPRSTMVAAVSDEASPSARSIAANLERFEQAEPELVHAVIGSRLSSSARVQPAVAMFDPESAPGQNPAPHYRLIARYAERVLSPKPAAPVLVREHLARRLADDLGDDMSRIGVGGDRVSLKF